MTAKEAARVLRSDLRLIPRARLIEAARLGAAALEGVVLRRKVEILKVCSDTGREYRWPHVCACGAEWPAGVKIPPHRGRQP